MDKTGLKSFNLVVKMFIISFLRNGRLSARTKGSKQSERAQRIGWAQLPCN